jgi:hypothetical protein
MRRIYKIDIWSGRKYKIFIYGICGILSLILRIVWQSQICD